MDQLCAKFDHFRVTEAKRLMWTIPPNMPKPRILEFLTVALEMPVPKLEEFLSEVYQLAPSLFLKDAHQPRTFHLAPPVGACLSGCGYKSNAKSESRELIPPAASSKVTVYDAFGVNQGHEHTLRCELCNSRYGYFWYYNKEEKANMFYDQRPDMMMVNERVYWTRRLYAFLINSVVHAQCTFEAFAQIARATFNFPEAFNRKMVSEAFYSGETEEELWSRKIAYKFISRKLNCRGVKLYVNQLRENELYNHTCSALGRERGCPYLHVMDGIWKLIFRHCSMAMEMQANIRFVNPPPVCPAEPANGEYYCKDHTPAAESRGMPRKKADFVLDRKRGPAAMEYGKFYDDMVESPGTNRPQPLEGLTADHS